MNKHETRMMSMSIRKTVNIDSTLLFKKFRIILLIKIKLKFQTIQGWDPFLLVPSVPPLHCVSFGMPFRSLLTAGMTAALRSLLTVGMTVVPV